MLVYQKKAMSLHEFSRMLEYLLEANSVDVTSRDFNYDLSKVTSNKLLDHMIGYTQAYAYESTHTSGSQIDYVYIKSILLEEFHKKTIVQNIFFSDHDAVRIIFWKK